MTTELPTTCGAAVRSSHWLAIMFYYFGSKARLAAAYPEPQCACIVEPFAGSAGYSCHHRLRNTALVERDPRICDLWRRLTAMTPDEIMEIPPPKVGDKSSDILVMLRAASEHSLTGRFITVTERMVMRWPNLVARAAELQPITKHWRIIEGDYTEAPEIEATWFIDPPYEDMSRGYAHKPQDYEALAEWCKTRNGQVIVCEQEGAKWLPFERLREIVTTANSKKTEVFWTRDLMMANDQAERLT